MALETLKEQMSNILKTISSLKDPEKNEAMGFIHQCLSQLEQTNNIQELQSKPNPNVHGNEHLTNLKMKAKSSLTVVSEPEGKRNRRKQVVVFKRKSSRNVSNVEGNIKEKKRRLEEIKVENTVKTLCRFPKTCKIVHKLFKCPEGCQEFTTKDELLKHFKEHSKVFMSCLNCRTVYTSVAAFWRHNTKGQCKFEQNICVKCDIKFKYHYHFIKHMNGHRNNDCQYCTEQFSTSTAYKEHLKQKHSDIKLERDLIPCKFCSRHFSSHSVLYNHYRLKHSRGKFVCLSCGLFLPTKEKYRDHCVIHENEKNWKCETCGLKFYRKQQYLVHIRIHQSGVYKCITCSRSITSLRELYQHKSDGHEVKGLEPKFECKMCNRKFTRKLNLQNHMSLHNGQKNYHCVPCYKKFRTSEALSKHEKTKKHLKKANFVLPESKYEKIYEDKFICENCGKQYNHKHELTNHLRVHKGSYTCDICNHVCSLKSNLKHHKKLHFKTLDVICEFCGDTFHDIHKLKNHMIYKHSQSKKIKCEQCGKCFKRNSDLTRHTKLHSNTRPFVCYCGQSYKLNSHLKRHQKLNHEKTAQKPEEPLFLAEISSYCDTLLLNDNGEGEAKNAGEQSDEFRLSDINVHLHDTTKEEKTEFSALDMTVLPSHHDIMSHTTGQNVQLLNLGESISHYNTDTDEGYNGNYLLQNKSYVHSEHVALTDYHHDTVAVETTTDPAYKIYSTESNSTVNYHASSEYVHHPEEDSHYVQHPAEEDPHYVQHPAEEDPHYVQHPADEDSHYIMNLKNYHHEPNVDSGYHPNGEDIDTYHPNGENVETSYIVNEKNYHQHGETGQNVEYPHSYSDSQVLTLF